MSQRLRNTIAIVAVIAGLVLGAVPAAAADADAAGEPPGHAWLTALDRAIDTVRTVARGQDDAAPPACDQLRNGDIPQLVADVFRCRLREAGVPEPEVARIVAEAVTVAQCESLFDPAAVVFDGRYVGARHPATGMFYTAAGVFQFIRKSADRWITGGYANVHDAPANIDAAARLYLHNVRRGYGGWADWACAAANDGFRATSVLPGWPGGPPHLPDWALQY